MKRILALFAILLIGSQQLPVEAQTFTGSGFFVSRSGLFVTNFHVIEEADEIRIRTVNGVVHRAQVVRRDPNNDLALLRVDGATFKPLPIASSTEVRRGEPVFALGFPQVSLQGVEPKLTDGTISSLSGMEDDPRHFQISNPIQPGNSGGPLVLEDGRLVGVIRSSLRSKDPERVPQNVNYAIKSTLLLEFLAGQNIGPAQTATVKPLRRTDMIANVEQSIGLVIASTSRPDRRKADLLPTPTPKVGVSETGSFPQRPISLIVPFAAGGPTDAIARRLASAIGRTLKVEVTVTNELGEGGLAGTRRVAQAAPDGYTLLFQNTSLIWTSPFGRPTDASLLASLTPIGKAIEVPMLIAANPQTQIESLDGLMSWLERRGTISVAHGPPGSASHACAVSLERFLRGKATLHAYSGGAPAVAAVLTGVNELICDQSPSLIGYLNRGLRGVAVASPTRLTSAFGVPTLLEQGADSLIEYWGGVFAPGATSPEVIARLTVALQAAVQDPELRRNLLEQGANPTSQDQATPDHLRAQLRKDAQRFARVPLRQ